MKQNRFCLIALLIIFGMLCTACAASQSGDQNAHPTQPVETSAIVQEADALFRNGEYAKSLEQYLTAMEENAKDMDARFGAVACQIEMGNYEIAAMNLSMAQRIQPSAAEICELYLKLSKAADNIAYARRAVEFATQYGHEEFLANVPAIPAIDHKAGSYSERIRLSITCEDADAEVYVTLHNDTNSNCSMSNAKYTQPIMLLRGENTVTLYAMKDGVPSETVTHTYFIDYDSEEVKFQEPLIEAVVRQELGKPSGPITNYDCEKVTEFDWYTLQDMYGNYNMYQQLRIRSLEDLQYLPCLTYLNIQYQDELTDFSPLQNCPMIEQVNMHGCDLTDCDFVTYVPNAIYLSLSDNKIADISALEQMTELRSLYIDTNDAHIKLDQVLRSNNKLNSLGIDDTQIEDYSALSELHNLSSLNIYGIAYIDYAAIGQLTKLQSLYFNNNYERGEYSTSIGDLSFLSQMKELRYLGLRGVNDPSDLAYVMQLPNLTSLSIYNSDATNDRTAMAALIQALPNCSINY